MRTIRNRIEGISDFYSQLNDDTSSGIPHEIIKENLDAATQALDIVINHDPEIKSPKPESPQDKMKVLPEQILNWLKITFGQDGSDKGDDKKRTFRGVVAAMRVIYGFKEKV
jgi:hypothetical protein